MRSEAEMMRLILSVAENLPQVDAVALEGSRMNQQAPLDIFQDFDVVYLVNDKEALLAERSWLQAFGPVLIQQTPEESELFPATLGERFTFLMLFEDGNRIDLTLCPYSELPVLLEDDPFIKVLWDPKEVMPQFPAPSDAKFWLQKPTQGVFEDCCNEFWWVTTYVVKGLCRQELMYATDHLYTICQEELLRMLSWQVGLTTGWNQSLGKNYKYLTKQLDEETNWQLFAMRNFTSFENIWQSLFLTQKLFDKVARNNAAKFGYQYDDQIVAKVLAYTHKWYNNQESIQRGASE